MKKIKRAMMYDFLGMLPITLFTIFAILYHIGHVEYDKTQKTETK